MGVFRAAEHRGFPLSPLFIRRLIVSLAKPRLETLLRPLVVACFDVVRNLTDQEQAHHQVVQKPAHRRTIRHHIHRSNEVAQGPPDEGTDRLGRVFIFRAIMEE